MSAKKVAKRYAQGLLEFTKETGNIQTVFDEMKDVAKTISDSKELKIFFATPVIDTRKKQNIAREIFSKFSPTTRNIISLIIRQGREKFLKDIALKYMEYVEALDGTQKITLITAKELSQQSTEQIMRASALVDVTKACRVKSIIRSELIGGYILRVGDKQIDNSVKTQLNNLRKEFQFN